MKLFDEIDIHDREKTWNSSAKIIAIPQQIPGELMKMNNHDFTMNINKLFFNKELKKTDKR